MTDADWLSCTTRPKAMLTAVRRRASGRKLQLLACGVCRLVWEHVPEPACKAAVAAAERFADGLLPADEFQAMARAVQAEQRTALDRSHEAFRTGLPISDRAAPLCGSYAANAVLSLMSGDTAVGLDRVFEWATDAAANRRGPAREAARKQQCDLLRELFPPPSRKYELVPVFAGGGLLLPNGHVFHPPDAARRLAESTVADGDYSRLPILADALEEADCPDAELLHHLRHGTHHARGCWAIDAVLGRS